MAPFELLEPLLLLFFECMLETTAHPFVHVVVSFILLNGENTFALFRKPVHLGFFIIAGDVHPQMHITMRGCDIELESSLFGKPPERNKHLRLVQKLFCRSLDFNVHIGTGKVPGPFHMQLQFHIYQSSFIYIVYIYL